MRLIAAVATGMFVVTLLVLRHGVTGSPRRRWRAGGSWRVWLAQAGLEMTPAQFITGSVVLAAFSFLVAEAVLGAWWLASVPAVAAGAAPHAFYERRRVIRMRALAEAWPDALRDVVADLSSGATLHQSLLSLVETGPAAIRNAIARYPIQSRTLGVVPALELIRERIADPTTDKVFEVVALAHRHGGRLTQSVLRDLVDEISEDVALDAEIRVDDTEQRLEARIVTAAPWFVLLILSAFPGAYREFYRSPAGAVVVSAAALWTAGGVLLLRRIRREQPEPRVLGGAALPAFKDGLA